MDNRDSKKIGQDNSILEVPRQVFEEFLLQLETTDVPNDVTARLRKTIIEEGKLNQGAIQKAIFPKD